MHSLTIWREIEKAVKVSTKVMHAIHTDIINRSEFEPHQKKARTMPAEDVTLEFAKLTDNAFTPTRGSKEAAGYDLYSAYDCTVPKSGKGIVKTDIQIALPHGCYGRIAPRSGLAAKHFIDVGGKELGVSRSDGSLSLICCRWGADSGGGLVLAGWVVGDVAFLFVAGTTSPCGDSTGAVVVDRCTGVVVFGVEVEVGGGTLVRLNLMMSWVVYGRSGDADSTSGCVLSGGLGGGVKKGDRIAQLICERIFIPALVEKIKLDDTDRGHGGFGSTGQK
ncbi:deoxyuridine 5'-triphosphate nucleotidohydrolase-like [Gigantopelta aegis]|uniref:deoxyuridine 5'-triphosphate nucleotidohydrolase-like n=1 Tax=Gigantopelta aegis TaxID=1735272 RepID=UPI001B8882F3|nr:deoxyuridine 5'-triphosphate nucleotidohydrolase-like [Gigantopelta aegis]